MNNSDGQHEVNQRFQEIFPDSYQEIKVSSYSGLILAVAAIAFVSCFGMFLYGVIS